MTVRHVTTVVALVIACVLPVPSSAQTPARESDLLALSARQPNDAAPLIELAKIYNEQRRFNEAVVMLQRATTLIQRSRVMIGGTEPVAVAGGLVAGCAADAQMPLRVGGDIREPRKIVDVKPRYPEAAQAARVQGIVILEILICADGTIRDAKVLRGQPLLNDAALEAVRQWKYTPTLLNGAPVSVVATVTVNFSLDGSGLGTFGPQVPVRVGGDVKEPKKIFDAKPTYPPAAQAARIQGIVILEAIIDTDGSVIQAKILRGQELLNEPAVEAVRQWRYEPTFLNGAPVQVIMTVTVNFTLAGQH